MRASCLVRVVVTMLTTEHKYALISSGRVAGCTYRYRDPFERLEFFLGTIWFQDSDMDHHRRIPIIYLICLCPVCSDLHVLQLAIMAQSTELCFSYCCIVLASVPHPLDQLCEAHIIRLELVESPHHQ